MPSRSQAQQRLMAIALHTPSKVKGKNKGVLQMAKSSLRDYAETKRKGLPKRKK
jgi:hypothetical protein